jgi:hypothetical protein
MDNLDKPQIFWDAFRKDLRILIYKFDNTLKGRARTDAWTRLRKQAAKRACKSYMDQLGLGPFIIYADDEPNYEYNLGNGKRVDVAAVDPNTNKRFILFESELGQPGRDDPRQPPGGKDPWTDEFAKLCQPEARAGLRVVSGIFRPGRGATFPFDLAGWLAPMKEQFLTEPGPFCLAFGPEDMYRDPVQPWLAFSLESDFSLRPLTSERSLRPYYLVNKVEGPEE